MRNHRLCEPGHFLGSGRIVGRIYDLPAGYPAISIPERNQLTAGSADILEDCRIQKHFEEKKLEYFRAEAQIDLMSKDWDIIRGEIYSFTNPQVFIPPIDSLEGFYPLNLQRSLYRRVLIPVEPGGSTLPVWTYVMDEPIEGRRIPEGIWKSV